MSPSANIREYTIYLDKLSRKWNSKMTINWSLLDAKIEILVLCHIWKYIRTQSVFRLSFPTGWVRCLNANTFYDNTVSRTVWFIQFVWFTWYCSYQIIYNSCPKSLNLKAMSIWRSYNKSKWCTCILLKEKNFIQPSSACLFMEVLLRFKPETER